MKPLYRDLSKLFGYAEQLNRRTDELKRLYRPGGLRRRIPIWSAASSGSLGDMTVLSLDGAIVDVELLFHSRREIWGTAKWLPDNPLPPSDHDLVNTAKAAIHGWNISLSSIWELVPWSWMGDYFANIGDYLAVHRNNVGAHPSEVCIMDHQVTHYVQSNLRRSPWLSATPGQWYYETKSRRLGDLDIDIGLRSVPGFGLEQLVNMASIFQSFGRRD